MSSDPCNLPGMTDDGEACAYTRLSYAPDGSLEKTDRQEEDCRAVAARLGWTVGQVFCDPSKSAWRRGVIRPGWEEMLTSLGEGRWRRVIVYHGDRLIRQPRDLERLLLLADERHIEMASVSGVRNLSSPDDRFILRIEAAQACRESDNNSRRAKRAHRASAENGRPHRGSRRPFGYNDTATGLVESEAAEIGDWARVLLAGGSVNGIRVSLVARGVPTVAGGTWRSKTISDILASPRLAGKATYHGQVVSDAVWPAILDADTWEAVQAVLAARSGAGGRKGHRDRVHLLSGIVRCGSCGGPMYAGKISDRARPGAAERGYRLLYTCRSLTCPGPKCARGLATLDGYVIGRVLGRLAAEDVGQLPDVDPVGPARLELAGVEARLAEIEAELGAPGAKAVAVLSRSAVGLERQAARLRARITAAPHRPRHWAAGLDRAGWDALPLDRRRAIVRDLYVVTCLPVPRGPGFSPDSIRLDPVE